VHLVAPRRRAQVREPGACARRSDLEPLAPFFGVHPIGMHQRICIGSHPP
jgi:hypothetical protein